MTHRKLPLSQWDIATQAEGVEAICRHEKNAPNCGLTIYWLHFPT
jgi:hypothetical protein